jgi:hypothetical protein
VSNILLATTRMRTADGMVSLLWNPQVHARHWRLVSVFMSKRFIAFGTYFYTRKYEQSDSWASIRAFFVLRTSREILARFQTEKASNCGITQLKFSRTKLCSANLLHFFWEKSSTYLWGTFVLREKNTRKKLKLDETKYRALIRQLGSCPCVATGFKTCVM